MTRGADPRFSPRRTLSRDHFAAQNGSESLSHLGLPPFGSIPAPKPPRRGLGAGMDPKMWAKQRFFLSAEKWSLEDKMRLDAPRVICPDDNAAPSRGPFSREFLLAVFLRKHSNSGKAGYRAGPTTSLPFVAAQRAIKDLRPAPSVRRPSSASSDPS